MSLWECKSLILPLHWWQKEQLASTQHHDALWANRKQHRCTSQSCVHLNADMMMSDHVCRRKRFFFPPTGWESVCFNCTLLSQAMMTCVTSAAGGSGPTLPIHTRFPLCQCRCGLQVSLCSALSTVVFFGINVILNSSLHNWKIELTCYHDYIHCCCLNTVHLKLIGMWLV